MELGCGGQRDHRLPDYYSILSRAVASLNPNTAQARDQLFERARRTLIQTIRDEPDRWTESAAKTEIANFDAATDRIESDIARQTTHDSIARAYPHPPDTSWDSEPDDLPVARPVSNLGRIVILSGAGLIGLLLIAAAIYALRGDQPAGTNPATPITAKPGRESNIKTASDTDDLEPGIDGGSTDAGLPYFLRRQAVYYRTVYTDGMILVDRSQRFLYLVQPQSRAWRYGIGVGGECAINAGLYRIQRKAQWPEWSPSPALLKRRTYPPRVASGPGNPLGAFAFYFENNIPGIHGTNSPKTIGHAPLIGCFRLINNDVVDLEKRVAVGTGVVVLN
jgi:lipoprotein-anchoring transpeptidase ErfK/SrfK